MSGCYPVNACHHVDGEFCVRCFNPHKDASPMVEKIQDLERRIDNVTKDQVYLMNFGPSVLVESIKVLEERISDVEIAIRIKHPHICPVCDGKYIAMFKECESACLACDKGIVWG